MLRRNNTLWLCIIALSFIATGVRMWMYYNPNPSSPLPQLHDEKRAAQLEKASQEKAAQESTATGKSFDELIANASAQRGRTLSYACKDCHTFDEDGPSRFGPNLFGIYGAKPAHQQNYEYSETLKAMGDKPWTDQNLNAFLTNPKAYAPDTKMGYPGVSTPENRADIIAYLKTLKP